VIGRILGLTCGDVTIERNEEEMYEGCAISWVERSITDWDTRGRDRRRSLLRARIMTLMAGREAEVVLLGNHFRGDGDDRREILLAVDPKFGEGAYDGQSALRWLRRLRHRTRNLVIRHRGLIDIIAAALLEQQQLSGLTVDTLMRQNGAYVPARVDYINWDLTLLRARAKIWANDRVSSRADWWEEVVIKPG
jgi:hypothetical protein